MYGKKGLGDPKKKKKKATTGKAKKVRSTLTKLPGRKVSKPKK